MHRHSMTDSDERPSRQTLQHHEVEIPTRSDRRMEVDGLPYHEHYFDRTIPGHPATEDVANYLGLRSSLYEPGASSVMDFRD